MSGDAKIKPTADRGLLTTIIEEMAKASDREADPHTKVEIKAALAKGLEHFADHDLYDMVQRIGDREPHCEVSPFTHTLCDLRRFYERPSPPSSNVKEDKTP